MKKITISLSFILLVAFAFTQITTGYDVDGNVISSNKNHKIIQQPGYTDAGNEWVSIGPFGGDAVDIAIDPTNTQKMFAGAGKPYKRNSETEPWQIIEGLLSLSPSGIHCFETNADGVIFAGGNYTYGKVFKSEDGGETWTQKSFPVSTGILNIAVDPSNPSIVYISTSSVLGVSQNKVIFKSVDTGNSWTALDMTSILPVGWACVDVTVDPANSETVFALGAESFSNAKAIVSFDGGSSWSDVSSGLPFGRPFNEVTIANGIVYICGGQLFGSQTMGVYKSENYGSSWTEFSSNFPNKVVNDFIVNPDDANKMYAATEGDGVYYSPNGGLTWLSNTGGVGDNGAARKILFNPDDPTKIYAGFLSLGVCMSDNSGNEWMSSSVGIASLSLNDIEIDPNNPDIILASFEAENSGGCYKNIDGEWGLVAGLPGTRFSSVSIGIDGTMYAWSNGPTSIAAEGVYKSSDGGDTWENMGPDIGTVFETQIFSMDLSATNANLIFIGGNNFGANGWASMIYRSTDAGENWENVYMGPENDGFKYVYIDPTSNDQVVYAAFKTESNHAGFIKSIDGGDTWTDINNGIPTSTKWAGAIICDPTNPETLYAGVGGYGGTTGTVYKSDNGGSLWTQTNLSLSNYSKVTDLLISPINNNVIYASTSLDGVYITEDAQNWEAANEGLPASNVTGLSRVFENDQNEMGFYGSTFTNSAFFTELYDPGSIGIKQNTSIENGIHIYPNPSNGDVNIDLSDLNETVVSIQVFNTNGNIVETEFGRVWTKGDNSINLNLNAGVYYILINTNTKFYSEKLIIVE